MEHYDAIVIGGGAAGLMCAAQAGQRGRRVLLIEHAARVGRKILMSGGGRCNFTNLYVEPERYLSANPHFCKSALARYTQWDFIALVERYRIAYHEKELGQLFCDESSKQILRMLLDECAAGAVQIACECSVADVTLRAQGGFQLATTRGALSADKLVVATGGLSIPKMGASGYGYALARQFGHRIEATRAGLVPLTLSGRPAELFADLSGVATSVEVRCAGQAFRGGLLLTHRGLSGPALLQISSYWQPGTPLQIDWLPELEAGAWLLAEQAARPQSELRSVLAEQIPKRLAQRLLQALDIAEAGRALRQWRAAELRTLGQQLQHWPLTVSGSEGYRTAEVTLGGVAVDELSSATLESRRVPGLHFVGEVVDVTGHLGGYNFQWAWASAVAAAQAL